MSQPLTAAILVVSTTAAQDASTDASTSALKGVFLDEGPGKWEVTGSEIVSDDVLAIQRQVTSWADSNGAPNLIITTGGTGFAVSDGTPEVSPSQEYRMALSDHFL
jgi:gephyrin